MPDVGERTLELAKEALAEQERAASDTRSRGAPILAGGGVVAGLLGKEAFTGGHPDGLAEWVLTLVGIGAGAGLLACVVALFVQRWLAFSVNARDVYREMFRRGITTQPLLDLELAELLVQARERNEDAVGSLRTALYGALACFLVLTVSLGLAAALAS